MRLYLITGVSLYRLNLGLIWISEKRRLGLLHQFEKSAAVVVTFRLGIIARKMHDGSSRRYFRVNYSRIILVSIAKNFVLTSFSFFPPVFAPTHHPTFGYLGIE